MVAHVSDAICQLFTCKYYPFQIPPFSVDSVFDCLGQHKLKYCFDSEETASTVCVIKVYQNMGSRKKFEKKNS